MTQVHFTGTSLETEIGICRQPGKRAVGEKQFGPRIDTGFHSEVALNYIMNHGWPFSRSRIDHRDFSIDTSEFGLSERRGKGAGLQCCLEQGKTEDYCDRFNYG
jgi:hypothetical protein